MDICINIERNDSMLKKEALMGHDAVSVACCCVSRSDSRAGEVYLVAHSEYLNHSLSSLLL